MATSVSASRLQAFQVSALVGSTHGWPAIHPNGDVAIAYTNGPAPNTVKVAILRRNYGGDPLAEPSYMLSQRITLGSPTGAATPSAGGTYSCAHPTICPIEDGFAVFWERKDTTIAATTMTAGGMQIEMAKLVAGGTQYVAYKSATEGKGYVLDNTVIAGHAGGTPRCEWSGRGNIVGLVYGHQLTYTAVSGTDHQRTYAVRAAYLDFSTDGKPVFITGGNRTGGSAVGEATDGGYAAGATQTYLVNSIDLDDDPNVANFNSGGGLPHCCFDMRGDFAVAYEARNGATGTGGIVMRIFKGPYRASGLDTAAIYTNTTDFGATATFLARRPILAFRNIRESGIALSGTNYPPILLTYGNVDDDAAPIADTALAKTITFPLNGAAPTVAAITIPVNQNYDATADPQALPAVVDASFLSAVVIQEALVATAGGDGYKFKIVHVDTALPGEIMFSSKVARPQRPNFKARQLRDGVNLAVFVYEGQEGSGSGSEHVFAEMFQFA